MSLCFVVPTMARKSNKLDYFKLTLKKNKKIFNTNHLCIFINTQDKLELEDELRGIEFEIIPRIIHNELSIFKTGSYDYWRSHLCADFIYCMSEATKLKPQCDYFVWLEDDVLIHPNFNNIWSKKPTPFTLSQSGVGGTFIIFSKEELLNIALPKIKENYLKDIPLDWNYQYFSQQTPLDTKLGFHIGEVSSRVDDNITRVNELEDYNFIKQ